MDLFDFCLNFIGGMLIMLPLYLPLNLVAFKLDAFMGLFDLKLVAFWYLYFWA